MKTSAMLIAALCLLTAPGIAAAGKFAALAVVPRHGAQFYGFAEGNSVDTARTSAFGKCADKRCKVVQTYRPGQCSIIVLATRQIFWDIATPATAEATRSQLVGHCKRIDEGCQVIVQQCE